MRDAGEAGGGPGRELVTETPEQTEDAGRELARSVAPGDLVLVSGELGAGKTTLIRGACRELGVEGPVTSPTFTLGELRRGRSAGGEPLRVAHLDLYRIADPEAEVPGLLDDYLADDTVTFVEWPEVGVDLPGGGALRKVRVEHAGGDRRRIDLG